MLLVVTYSSAARQTLRNVCDAHEAVVVRRFGRAALLEASELGALLALRIRERHGSAVQVERTRPFNEFDDAPDRVQAAARAYEERASKHTPYAKFAAGTDHPQPEDLAEREL